MNDDSILDEMDLPLTNPNEELETISKNLLLPHFDTSKFEIRSEDFRVLLFLLNDLITLWYNMNVPIRYQ